MQEGRKIKMPCMHSTAQLLFVTTLTLWASVANAQSCGVNGPCIARNSSSSSGCPNMYCCSLNGLSQALVGTSCVINNGAITLKCLYGGASLPLETSSTAAFTDASCSAPYPNAKASLASARMSTVTMLATIVMALVAVMLI